MSLYYCGRCHRAKDNDVFPCYEDPSDHLGLICEICYENDKSEKEKIL